LHYNVGKCVICLYSRTFIISSPKLGQVVYTKPTAGEGTPLPYASILPPSALAVRPSNNSSQIYAYGLRHRAPSYIADFCLSVSEVPGRQHLRSARCYQLSVPRVLRSTFGTRAFSAAGPTVWNSLPNHLRDPAVVDLE